MNPKIFLAVAQDDKLWTTSEICSVLFALLQTARSKPWWVRWTWRPWSLALETALGIFTNAALMKYEMGLEPWSEALEDIDFNKE